MTSFRELSDELDIVYWLDREGISYKLARGKSGMQVQIKECPCCGNRNWKVYLNAETGLGNCFVCDTKFNSLSFIKAELNISWKDLKTHIMDVLKEQGWMPKKSIPVAVDETKVLLPDCFDLPTPDNQNLKYLEERKVNGELAKYFNLKYCVDGWWNWEEDGVKKGQNFSSRIIIPIYDLNGTIVTFQGRDITGDAERKYLFPSQLPGSGRFLFNGQNVQGAKRICIGEGVFDVMAIKRAFDQDSSLRDVVPIGTFGKHLSSGDDSGNDQLGRLIRLKRDGVQEVTIMWDGEKDALDAALRAAKIISSIGLTVKIALLPVGKDPNEVNDLVVRDAYYKASLYSSAVETRLRVKSPYPDKQKTKLYSLMS